MDYKDKPVVIKEARVQQEYLDPRDYRAQHLKEFLKKISMLESSGGKDIEHDRMLTGLQAGDKAIGEYGLMPNTLVELAKRYPSDTSSALPKEGLEMNMVINPQFEETMAGTMADYLKNKRGLSDDEAAAAWEAGHNKPAKELDLKSPRAKKFKVLGKASEK